jgi:hypothetical protein
LLALVTTQLELETEEVMVEIQPLVLEAAGALAAILVVAVGEQITLLLVQHLGLVLLVAEAALAAEALTTIVVMVAEAVVVV